MTKQKEQQIHLRERLIALKSLAIQQRITIDELSLLMSKKFNNHVWFVPRVYVKLQGTNDHIAVNEFPLKVTGNTSSLRGTFPMLSIHSGGLTNG